MDTRDIRRQCLSRLSALKTERASWESDWREIADVILPRRGRWLATDRNRSTRRNRKIIDNTGTTSLRTMAAGLMSGITSPARPWFSLAAATPGLQDDDEVKVWLAGCTALLQDIFSASNAYDALASVYEELSAFGTAAMVVLSDEADVITCETLTAGQYYVSAGKTGKVDTLYRSYSMTVAQLVDEFAPLVDGARDWSVIAPATRTLHENGQFDAWVELLQAIEPNRDAKPGPGPAWRKAWRSVWIEIGAPDDRLLRLSGFDEFPAMCPRWNLTPGDIYGTSPAMDALGDAQQLQAQEKKKGRAIEKMVDPSVNVPPGLKAGSRPNLDPGGVNFFDQLSGPTQVTPVQVVQPRLGEMQQDMDFVRRRIRDAFYVDLWLMISQDDRSGITATEINARREEKLLMLGPVLERLHHELLDPLIKRVFAIAVRAGLIPPPPAALAKAPPKIKYISMLAQAQRAVAAGSIERLCGFVGNLAQADPAILDKVDFDRAVDKYADVTGADPQLLRPDDQVAQMRQGRAQAQQAQQAMAMMQQGAAGAELLSRTDTTRPSALTGILNNVTGGGAA